MRTLPPIVAAALLAACSGQPADPGANTSVDQANTVAIEDVPASETDIVPAPDGNETVADTDSTAADVADPTGASGYTGRWTGVEGMYLVVTDKPGGGVALDMQWDLDHRGKFDGSITAEGLRFMRGGVAETAVRTDGAATGLKYLAGKKDCLTVKPGEGYCRG